MSRLSVRFVATSLAVAVLAAPSRGAAQAAPAPAPQAVLPQAVSPAPAPQGARVLTLDDALALADVRNETVLIAEAGVRRARGVEAQVHSQRLPQLTGAASYDRTLKSEFEGIFDADTIGGGEDGGDNAFADLPFGQPNAYRLGLSFSQLIYAGGRERALERQARFGRESASLSVGQTKAQLAFDVAQAFYDAALADRIFNIADETLAQATRTLEQTRTKREAGLVSEFELLRAQVDRDTLQAPRVRAGNNRDVAYFRLKQLVDLPLGEPIAARRPARRSAAGPGGAVRDQAGRSRGDADTAPSHGHHTGGPRRPGERGRRDDRRRPAQAGDRAPVGATAS